MGNDYKNINGMEMVNDKRGYVVTYNWVLKLLKDCDFDTSAKKLNIKKEESSGGLLLDFFGRTYLITKEKIELVREQIKWQVQTEGFEYNIKSILGYYVLTEAPEHLEHYNDYCKFSYFSHGVFRNDALGKDPLAEVYGNDYKKFESVCSSFGFNFLGEKGAGQFVWQGFILPKIPVRLVYYEGDDEYPTKIEVLFDKTAIMYFKFEPLGVLLQSFIGALATCSNVL
jgi:hypothetical protein